MTALESAIDRLVTRDPGQGITLAFILQQHGDIVAERYGIEPADDFEPERSLDADSTLISWSMAKSITHAAVGILVADGLIDLDAPAPVPEWAGTDKADITTLQLLEMRPGLHFVEDYVDGDTSNCIEMLFGGTHSSCAAYAANQPLVHPPGTVWNYSSGTTNIVARIVGDIVHGSTGGTGDERRSSMDSFLHERLFDPTGMASATAKFDGAGTFVGSSYVYATARDFARFGELYRHDGVTDLGRGTRLLPVGWTDHARTQVATDPENGLGYGRHWWLWPQFPGSLACQGYEGQFTIVVPDRELVLVHLGKTDADVQPQLRDRLADIIAVS